MSVYDSDPTLIKVPIRRKNRVAQIAWLRKNIRNIDRFVHMQNGQYRFLIYAYLTSEELLVFRLAVG